jgi:hypothetical protein
MAMGLELCDPAGTVLDEFDVVAVRGARVLVVEAKARATGGGGGADLQKRIHKVHRFFGRFATVVFVHPAWGPAPPPALAASAGPGIHLVGSDLGALDRAIREAVG